MEFDEVTPGEPGASHGEGDLGKSRGLLRHRERPSAELSIEFIEVEKANYDVTMLCRVLGVGTSSFYDWRRRDRAPRPGRWPTPG